MTRMLFKAKIKVYRILTGYPQTPINEYKKHNSQAYNEPLGLEKTSLQKLIVTQF